MDFISTQKYVGSTPRKLRLVANAAKKLSPAEAVEMLPYSSKRAAEPLVKVIKTAVANAQQQGISPDRLTFKEIQIGDGPRLKRGRIGGRSTWKPVLKRMSHIRVVVTTKDPEPRVKKQTKNSAPSKKDSKQDKNKEQKGKTK